MRPLVHPAIEDVPLEAILHALGDPTRVAIYAGILASEKPQSCNAFAHLNEQPIPKSTLSEHFKVLREAGLIRSERSGVEMKNSSRCGELETRFPGLVTAILNAHKKQLEEQVRVEQAARRKSKRG
ncbi:MAG: helix-turn-helix transcriptional regulator [Deltaproteobacteria bacterium]|nr:helix-turn-helix transcriptional regulator [Deltaproteobacteria bacterium]